MMDLTEAEHLLKRWDPNFEPATPRTIEALDIVQFEHDAAQATDRFKCPTCRAQIEEPCEGGVTHARRINKLRRFRPRRVPVDPLRVRTSLPRGGLASAPVEKTAPDH